MMLEQADRYQHSDVAFEHNTMQGYITNAVKDVLDLADHLQCILHERPNYNSSLDLHAKLLSFLPQPRRTLDQFLWAYIVDNLASSSGK